MSQREMQFAYQNAQLSRVTTEAIRSSSTSCNHMDDPMPMVAGAGHMFGGLERPSTAQIVDIPAPEKCIGQVVLDWEFIHDLDLHLLRVADQSQRNGNGAYSQVQEPNPEPNPATANEVLDLETLVAPNSNELRQEVLSKLTTVVYYGNKTCDATGSDIPQAALQLDRNAAVHSHKPVENLYLTEKLEPGVYVIGVHNYTQRQLMENIIGPADTCQYKSFDDFKKADPGYLLMEKALSDQNAHAEDEDGTPEKTAIMTKVDEDMRTGSQMMQSKCGAGTAKHGVHYGITVYTYPDQAMEAKHPQAAPLEELQSAFKSEFFATADCVFNPAANPSGYNAANVLADTQTAEGAKALSHGKAAHVALLKVTKEAETGRAKLAEVRILNAMPRAEMVGGHGQPHGLPFGSAMNIHRMQQMRGPMQQMTEPCPEPSLQMAWNRRNSPLPQVQSLQQRLTDFLDAAIPVVCGGSVPQVSLGRQ